MKPLHSMLRLAVLVAALALCTGPTAHADDPVDQGEVAGRELRSLAALDDPARDGWDTEVFADAAGGVLKKLGKLIAGPGPVPPEPLAELLAPDFRTTLLRPATLTPAYTSASIEVRRGAGVQPAHPEPGALGLTQQLGRLREPFGTQDGVRVWVKVFQVRPGKTEVGTTSYMEVSGAIDGGTVQIQATWACRWAPEMVDGHPRLLAIEVVDYEETIVHAPRTRTLFTDCTQAVLGANPSFAQQLIPGVQQWVGRIELALGMDLMSRCGPAIGDVNGDGLEDLYVCQPSGLPNRLFVQNPDGTATDKSAEAGVDFLEHTSSALLIDLDGDGDSDLVAATRWGVLFLENDGTGKFQQRARELPEYEDVQSLAAADYDQDGDLDLYVCIDFFSPASHPDVPTVSFVYTDANDGGANHLFRNDGAWRFTDVTREVGLDQDNRRHSLAAMWEDYDNDGDPDLYVANDYGRNCLYRNDRGTFTNVAAAAGVEDCASGMSVAWNDIDHDGDMDLYVSNMWSSAGGRITWQDKWKQDLKADAKSRYQRFAKGNTLLRNRGDGTFEDISEAANVAMGRWAWSAHFLDINNDGWDDLFVTNGYLTGDDPKDL